MGRDYSTWRLKADRRRPTAFLRVYVGAAPAGVHAKALDLGKLLTLAELDAHRGEHGPPVADEGAGEGRFVPGSVGMAVGPVAGEYVFQGGHHSVTAQAWLKPGVSSKALRTSSGTGSSTVTVIAAREPGSPRPTAMLPMLMPCSPRTVPSLPIMPGTSSLRIKSMCFSGTMSMSKPMTSTSRGCILGPTSVPLTTFSPRSSSSRRATRLV